MMGIKMRCSPLGDCMACFLCDVSILPGNAGFCGLPVPLESQHPHLPDCRGGRCSLSQLINALGGEERANGQNPAEFRAFDPFFTLSTAPCLPLTTPFCPAGLSCLCPANTSGFSTLFIRSHLLSILQEFLKQTNTRCWLTDGNSSYFLAPFLISFFQKIFSAIQELRQKER